MRKKTIKEQTADLLKQTAPRKVSKALTKQELSLQLAKQVREGSLSVYDAGTSLGLNPQQIRFVELWHNSMGNTIDSYCEAYGIDSSKKVERVKASVSASRLTSNPKVIALINMLLDVTGVNIPSAIMHMKFLMEQKQDLAVSERAADKILKYLGAIKSDQATTVHNTYNVSTLSPEQLDHLLSIKEQLEGNQPMINVQAGIRNGAVIDIEVEDSDS
ncbi:MAG: hypothetical protein WDM78_11615 [Puia sp.]